MCIRDRFVRADYGTLVDPNLASCVNDSGTISTNTTAASGCIKIVPGTTLAIVPSNTYTIPSQLTTPSTTIDYGNVADGANARIDHGHILDTSDLRTPFGLFRIKSVTDVVVKRQFSYVGTAPVLKLSGEARVPLEAAVYGKGNLFAIGGAAEASVGAVIGSGIGRLSGNAIIGIAVGIFGSGSLRNLGGYV